MDPVEAARQESNLRTAEERAEMARFEAHERWARANGEPVLPFDLWRLRENPVDANASTEVRLARLKVEQGISPARWGTLAKMTRTRRRFPLFFGGFENGLARAVFARAVAQTAQPAEGQAIIVAHPAENKLIVRIWPPMCPDPEFQYTPWEKGTPRDVGAEYLFLSVGGKAPNSAIFPWSPGAGVLGWQPVAETHWPGAGEAQLREWLAELGWEVQE